jgi:hypothetical protein
MEVPNLLPAHTRQARVAELLVGLQRENDRLIEFVGLTTIDRKLEAIDDLLRSSPFLTWARDAVPVMPLWRGSEVLANQAADLVELLQRHMPAAHRAAGSSWRFGEWGAVE